MIDIPKFITRDFSLALVQIWGRSYFRMFGAKIKTVPRNVFIVEGGVATDYRHPALNAEVNAILLKRLANSPHFIQQRIRWHTRKHRELQKFFGRPMSEREFQNYLKLIVEAWPGFYLSIYAHEDSRFPKEDVKRLKEFRLNTETLLHKIYDAVDDGLRLLYPELGALSRYLTLDEIQDGAFPKKQELQNRAQRRLILVDGFITSASGLERLKKQHDFSLETPAINQIDEVEGRPAYEGLTSGIVRIAVRKKDFECLKSGEILVCPMTIPTFANAIAKAAAIVTDEGGITCHAAIVARELKKPCIIGTKIATKVLKDGDMVEVDAERGIVKIITRA